MSVQRHPTRIEELLGASAGTEVELPVDLIVTDDWTTPALMAPLAELGTERALAPIVLVRDHTAPVESYREPEAAKVRSLRQVEEEFVSRFGARRIVDQGIQHHALPAAGLLELGMLVLGNDSHTPTLGAYGVAAFAAQPSTIAVAIHTGKVVLRVPETLRVSVVGHLRAGVTMRDAALTLLGLLRAGGDHPRLATGKALEFSGPGLAALSGSERAVLANIVPEAVAVTATFSSPDTASPGGAEATAADLTLDLSTVVPAVARSGRPTDVVALDDLGAVRVDRVFVGTCAGGTFEEISAFAEAMGERACIPTVVAPASAAVSTRLEADGVRARLEAAGVTILPPGCGPCFGFGFRLDAGEVAAVTGNRNGVGRMGSPEAQILLVSGATAGHAARTGRLGAGRVSAPNTARPTVTWPSTGNVVRLHGPVSTDDLTPSSVPGIGTSSDPDPQVARRLLLHHIDPTAAERDLRGCVIVADENFGMGSNRASSVRALVTAGVAAIVARSVAPLYRSGARDEGLLTLTIDDDEFYAAATSTATVRCDAHLGRVTVDSQPGWGAPALEFRTAPASEYEIALVGAGGAVAYLRSRRERVPESAVPRY